MKSKLITKGFVEIIIEEKGKENVVHRKNTVLNNGKRALAMSLANQIGNNYEFYISKMLFGDGGTISGVPKFVDSGRNGLFGITRAVKPVVSSVDPVGAISIFTSVLTYDDANDVEINEVALQMKNGDLYSMMTFAGFNKTDVIQITFNWRLVML